MPRVAAFFDMDRTLLRCNTGTRWIVHAHRAGQLSTWKAVRAVGWLLQYKLSILDMEAVTTIAAADLRGGSEDEAAEETRRWFEREIVREIAPAAEAAVERHRREGHVLAILSSSTQYVTEPLAERLGIDHVLCTRFEVDAGRFAGRHVAPACYGAGKVHWAERFAKQHDVDLDGSWFYTDSYSDLPMLQRVGVRKVINPDARLLRHARRAGWDIEQW